MVELWGTLDRMTCGAGEIDEKIDRTITQRFSLIAAAPITRPNTPTSSNLSPKAPPKKPALIPAKTIARKKPAIGPPMVRGMVKSSLGLGGW